MPTPNQPNPHRNQSIPTVHVMTLFADLLHPMTPITLLGHGKKGAIKGLAPTYISQNRGFHAEIKGFLGTTWDIIRIYPSSSRGSRGQKFQKKKNYRNILPIECAQGDRPARCPNHFFAVNEPSAVPWWWCDLFRCHEVACGVRWSNVVGCEVTWGELLWLVATWHVMSCHLMWWSRHLMRCDCCVVSCHVMQCDVMVMSSYLLRPAMGWNAMSLRCHWLWGHLVWFDVVL